MKDEELRVGQVFSWAQLKEELDVEPEPFGEFEDDEMAEGVVQAWHGVGLE